MEITIKVSSIEELRAFAQDVVAGQVAIEKPTKNDITKAIKELASAPVVVEKAEAPERPTQEQVDEAIVKALLTSQLKAGKKLGIKALFSEYGVTKLSELLEKAPEKLEEFYLKASDL